MNVLLSKLNLQCIINILALVHLSGTSQVKPASGALDGTVPGAACAQTLEGIHPLLSLRSA